MRLPLVDDEDFVEIDSIDDGVAVDVRDGVVTDDKDATVGLL
jgi:hypothetical protein